MSIITIAQAVPSRLFSIYAALYESSAGELKDRLEASATPPSLRTRGGDEDGELVTTLFKNTLTEARRLGLVEEVEDRLRIPNDVRSSVHGVVGRETKFRDHLLKVLFNTVLAEDAQQSGFMLALSWFLTNSPLIPLGFSTPPQNQLEKKLGTQYSRTELTSLSRYQNFLYWARFLGFATIVGRDNEDGKDTRWVFPDPLVAIDSALLKVFSDDSELSVEIFMARLCNIYPVFEGGTARQEIDSMLGVSPYVDDRKLSQSTSVALQRLQDRQRLNLVSRSDAPMVIFDLGTSERRVSHVIMRGQA
jgi:hypothetical protein